MIGYEFPRDAIAVEAEASIACTPANYEFI
jgi:hypothetical protein